MARDLLRNVLVRSIFLTCSDDLTELVFLRCTNFRCSTFYETKTKLKFTINVDCAVQEYLEEKHHMSFPQHVLFHPAKQYLTFVCSKIFLINSTAGRYSLIL